MDFIKLRMSVVLYSVLFASSLSAAPATSTRQARIQTERSKPQTLALALTIQNGYASLGSETSSASGAMAEFLILTSYTTRDMIFDLGAGFMSSSLTGSSSNSSLQSFEMTTSSFVAQFSPQYRWTENLQIGPALQLLVGDDVGFRPGIGFTGQTAAWLGGAQALYGFKIESFRIKLGLNYLRSLNLEEKNLQSVQAALQIGLPIL